MQGVCLRLRYEQGCRVSPRMPLYARGSNRGLRTCSRRGCLTPRAGSPRNTSPRRRMNGRACRIRTWGWRKHDRPADQVPLPRRRRLHDDPKKERGRHPVILQDLNGWEGGRETAASDEGAVRGQRHDNQVSTCRHDWCGRRSGPSKDEVYILLLDTM